MEFKKAEELSIFFQVYNSGLDPAGKPNLTLEYEFHKTEGTGEKFFNKTNPQTVNATNLPPQFDPAKFPVPGGITVPLASFARGPVPPEHQDHRQGAQQQGRCPRTSSSRSRASTSRAAICRRPRYPGTPGIGVD